VCHILHLTSSLLPIFDCQRTSPSISYLSIRIKCFFSVLLFGKSHKYLFFAPRLDCVHPRFSASSFEMFTPFSEYGCDRYFCGKHLQYIRINGYGERCRHKNDCECDIVNVCERCEKKKRLFPYKPEHPTWVKHLLTDESWVEWRKNNPQEVAELRKQIPLEHKGEK